MIKARAANCFLAIQIVIALTLSFIQVKVIDGKTLRVTLRVTDNFYLCLSHSFDQEILSYFYVSNIVSWDISETNQKPLL